MILKGLEMQGFKSFPDKTRLEFGKGMTAVVGPNGSGKSNISDAVRWVLGEQSTKNLRGSKMEDVIFGGTSLRKPLSFAEVTLHLDNSDKTLARDNDQVSVTRRLYRSGESTYKINGEECRLRDIHELFMDTGLGRDGYSMVSQGRIADLVSAKSSQRRDMLEEASGISHFRYRRNDANRKLEAAEENLVRLRDIQSELGSRVGPLKTQSEKAVKFLALADERKTLEIGLWLYTIERNTANLIEQEKKLTIATAQYSDTDEKLTGIADETEKALEKARQITALVENLRIQISQAEEKAATVAGEINVEKSSIEHNNKTIERIKADMGSDEKSIADIDTQIEEAGKEIEQKKLKAEEKRAELEKEVQRFNSLLLANGENSDKAAQLSTKLNTLTMQSADLRVEKSTNESSANELKERIEAIETLVASRADVIKELEEQKNNCQSKIRTLKDQYDESSNSVDGYRMIVDVKGEKAEKLTKEIEKLNFAIYQKNARIKMLDDLEKNLDGYSGSVQKVIKEANRGALRGIHGTLSQLITVPAQYAVAIETALGTAIQNVVVDDESTAKRAINFLKENRAGRATFLPLTTVKEREFTEKGLENCEGFVSTAERLPQAEAKYSGIISNLLSRTVIVETIDNGIAMAKKYGYRFKIVTLDGQVINAGGSITGGSRGAGSGLLSRINEIEDLKNDVAALEKEMDEKSATLKELNDELNVAKARIDANEAELIKLQEEIIRAESESDLALDRYNSAVGHIEELEAEKERALAKISQNEAAVTEIDRKLAETEKEIGKLNRELALINETRDSFEAQREKEAEKQNVLNLEILALRKEIEACNDTIESLVERKNNYGVRSDELLKEIEDINAENEQREQRIAELEKQEAAYKTESEETKTRIDELFAERDKTEGESSSLRIRERQLSEDKEKLSGELARLEERKEALEKELESTKSKLFDEYQLSVREAQEVGTVPENITESQRTLAEIKNKIRALGSVNVGAIDEYKEVSERYEYLSGQMLDVEKSKTELEKLISDLTGKMAEKFREQFRLINTAFGETFKDLFGGGRAELALEDPQDVLECNINIKVQPPGKNVQNIDLLSGGEKGLAAIALLIAILKINPAPFCIFDEVEAALDDVNVSRYAQYLRSMCKKIQFILITHRRGTMDEADILYGVTMQEEGVSKLLELKSAEMALRLGLEQ